MGRLKTRGAIQMRTRRFLCVFGVSKGTKSKRKLIIENGIIEKKNLNKRKDRKLKRNKIYNELNREIQVEIASSITIFL